MINPTDDQHNLSPGVMVITIVALAFIAVSCFILGMGFEALISKGWM